MALPSIRRRLADALLWWSLAWSVAVAAAVWLAARHEVDELLDDTLRASAEVLGAMLSGTAAVPPPAAQASGRFAWQVVDAGGGVTARSAQAPAQPMHGTPSAGFSDTAGWRVFGTPLGEDGRILYVAQTRAERVEAHTEVVLGAVTSALAIGLLGHLWLRARVRRDLADVPPARLARDVRLGRGFDGLAELPRGGLVAVEQFLAVFEQLFHARLRLQAKFYPAYGRLTM